MRASYPVTGTPVEPASASPARFEMKMWRSSVVPMPSRMGFPVREVHASKTGAGSVSPADTARRSDVRSAPSSIASSIAR